MPVNRDFKRFAGFLGSLLMSEYGNAQVLCLTYAGTTNSHQAMGGEFMGNYNYGYTGKLLFSLQV